MTISLISDELRQASTPKKELLERMDRIIPWSRWIELVLPYYYKGERGNKPFPLERMLRIYVIQNLYNLADMAAKNEIIDSRAFSDFCGVDSSNQVPDGDTIGRFRNILKSNSLQDQLFDDVVRLLESEGLILHRGTIVDSTLIASPSSTKNKEKSRDPEAHQSKKGNQWHFGYKAHIGVDTDTGLIHTLETTAGNISDVSMTSKLLTGEEEEVNGDAGYLGANKRKDAITRNKFGKKIKYRICRRPSQYKARKAEYRKSSVRCKVEHVFGVIKNLFRCRKTRYRGKAKVDSQLKMVFALGEPLPGRYPLWASGLSEFTFGALLWGSVVVPYTRLSSLPYYCVLYGVSLDKIRGVDPCKQNAYIASIVKNSSINYVVKRNRRSKYSFLSENEQVFDGTVSDESVVDRLLQESDVYSIRSALLKLSARDRTILGMKYFDQAFFSALFYQF